MKHFRISIAFSCLLICPASLSAAPPADAMTFVQSSGGTFRSTWPGIAGRSYFYQWSSDLTTWHYAPFLAFGTGAHEHVFASGEPTCFVRLLGIDDPAVTSLREAEDADFDNDGVSNIVEVAAYGSNPNLTNAASGGMTFAEKHLSGRDITLANPVADGSTRVLDVYNLSPF